MKQVHRLYGTSPITEEPDELIGRPPLSKTNEDKPCTTGMTVTMGQVSRDYSDRKSMARQPPLSIAQVYRWQQQSLTETFASYFPEEIFDGFNLPCIEEVVNLPAFSRHAEWAAGRGIPPVSPRPPAQVEKIAARAAKRSRGGAA